MTGDLRTVFHADSDDISVFRNDAIHIAKVNIGGHFIQLLFWNLLGWAGSLSLCIEGRADPNDAAGSGFPAVVLSTVSADDHAGKRISRSIVPLGRCVLLRAPFNLGLYRVKDIQIDDRLMGIRCVIHGHFTVVRHGFLTDIILTVGLLQEKISRVGVVFQNFHHRAFVPDATQSGRNTVRIQSIGDRGGAFPGKILPIDPADGFGFGRLDHIPTIVIPITQQSAAPGLSFLKVFLDPPFLVFAYGLALCLCKGCQDGKHQFSVCGERLDVLFLKMDIHSQGSQVPDRFQKRDRISGEAGDALGQNDVNQTGSAVGKQLLKLLPAVLSPGFGFIRIYPNIFPTGVGLDVTAVMTDLRRQAVVHGILCGGYTGVCSHALFPGHLFRKYPLFYCLWHILPSLYQVSGIYYIARKGRYSKDYAAKILPESKPYFLVKTVSIFRLSLAEIRFCFSIFSTIATAA